MFRRKLNVGNYIFDISKSLPAISVQKDFLSNGLLTFKGVMFKEASNHVQTCFDN